MSAGLEVSCLPPSLTLMLLVRHVALTVRRVLFQ